MTDKQNEVNIKWDTAKAEAIKNMDKMMKDIKITKPKKAKII